MLKVPYCRELPVSGFGAFRLSEDSAPQEVRRGSGPSKGARRAAEPVRLGRGKKVMWHFDASSPDDAKHVP